ncbi:hypothetical protein [Roseibium denhamense]|uniref:DUF4383 domain-containing protein n=2 Tax=Roseibium denhamense TaxID=76305 RepID=A0ABY1PP50_9HYPH|nr:hypothetical protein [Roseibium denhamense]SMP37224.1 hypothetical protein SAMN06265374_0023 [Roseibium denhamense]
MTQLQSTKLKIITVLWVIWGLVHALAGVLTIAQGAPDSIAGVADAVDPAMFHATYHTATDALINQHGYNLLWIGLFTVAGGIYIWRGDFTWLFFTAVVGGLTDVGYFVFMDLGGFVHFFPGTVMTLVSGSAILLSVWVGLSRRNSRQEARTT